MFISTDISSGHVHYNEAQMLQTPKLRKPIFWII